MSNMSYCRVHNTLLALEDCQYNMEDTDLSSEEQHAKERLIELCSEIAESFKDKE